MTGICSRCLRAAAFVSASSSTSTPRPGPSGTGENPSITGIFCAVMSSSYWSSRVMTWAVAVGRTAAWWSVRAFIRALPDCWMRACTLAFA